jgi:hypothetical protein
MSSTAEKNGRQNERIAISLPIRVTAHEKNSKVWGEVTHLESVSGNGAGFYLSRAFEVGQLLYLSMPIERDLRKYDFDAEQYAVWGIVRHCHRTLRNKFSVYHLGVAFIGSESPRSYRRNPLTIYKLDALGEDGFWSISEEARPDSSRRQPRYPIPIEVYVAVYDAEENIVAHEKTVTENISESGASVFSGLRLNIGDTVRVIKQHGGFSVDAVVRNCRVGEDNLPRLHLEFVNVRFPLDGIE